MPTPISPDEIVTFFKSLIGKDKRFTTAADMAKFLGLGTQRRMTLDRFLAGVNTSYTSVIEWFLKLGGQIAFPDSRLEEYEFVPRVQAVAGCGESLVTDGDVAGMYAFRKSFLEAIHVRAKDAVMMYVSGDSMEPLICDRDTVLFNAADNEPRDGHLYVVSLGGSLMVKRLQTIPNGWQLCSENHRYGPIPIQGDELEKFRVHGRVRWFGRVL